MLEQSWWARRGGRVVRVAHEDGEVGGFIFRASQEGPRYIAQLEDGRQAAHTADALHKI